MPIKDLIAYAIILTITILINARIYWLIKYRHDDPLKVLKPFWISNDEDKKDYDKAMENG